MTRKRLCVTLLLVLAGLGMTGCASLPDQRQVKRFLGLEQPFAHNDIPAPATPGGYVSLFGMGQTDHILVSMQQGAVKYELSDAQAIHKIVTIIRTASQANTAASTSSTQQPIQLTFLIGSPQRSVSAYYIPATQALHLYNIPTASWPDHAVAVYTVAPDFGAALLSALDAAAP